MSGFGTFRETLNVMRFFAGKRDSKRERIAFDAALQLMRENRDLQAHLDAQTAETERITKIAVETAGFGQSLREAVDAAMTADRDLCSIEASHGIVRPSRRSTPDLSELDALWRALPDPLN
jgi:hypothetical protein